MSKRVERVLFPDAFLFSLLTLPYFMPCPFHPAKPVLTRRVFVAFLLSVSVSA